MVKPFLDSRVLGQLLLMQSIMGSLPDESSIFSFVCKGLLDVPGVDNVICSDVPQDKANDTCAAYPIYVDNLLQCHLLFTISDRSAFEPYEEYIKNFIFMLSVILEERNQRTINDSHKKNLEKRVEKRTIELQNEILERTKAEEALHDSEQLFRSTFESASIGICLTHPDGTLLKVNPAFASIFGYEAEELENRNFQKYTHKDDIQMSYEQMKPLLSGECRSIQFEKRYVHRSGRTIWATVGSFLQRYKDGSPQYFITHITDITDQKNAEKEKKLLEEQLQQAHKMEAIGTLAGGIAHDFNNLLTVIIGFSDIADEDIPIHSPAKESISQVLQAAHRAKDLVKQILSFSRKQPRVLVPTEIGSLVKETLKLLRASIPTTIDIQLTIDSSCGSIMADQGQINQILLNLCTNAAQAMEDSGGILHVGLNNIEISTKPVKNAQTPWPGHYLVLSVSDTGRGIGEGLLDKIFDPYFTTKAIGKGSGMGLSVVHGLVKSHNGSIFVESKPGVGTTFKIYFPRVEQEAGVVITNPQPLPAGKERILVVDDEEMVAEMTKRTIEKLGYNVIATSSSMAALELFREDPSAFDLVLTDQTMPQLTGDQLAAQLSKLRSDLPVIICSGFSSKFDSLETLPTGISAYLEKPIDRQKLAETIRASLDNS